LCNKFVKFGIIHIEVQQYISALTRLCTGLTLYPSSTPHPTPNPHKKT
jgi:hypothetical protein